MQRLKVTLTIIISDSNQCHSIPEHHGIGNIGGVALYRVDGNEQVTPLRSLVSIVVDDWNSDRNHHLRRASSLGERDRDAISVEILKPIKLDCKANIGLQGLNFLIMNSFLCRFSTTTPIGKSSWYIILLYRHTLVSLESTLCQASHY